MNYAAWNRYVLMAIGVFAVLLYVGFICAGAAGLVSRISKSKTKRKRLSHRVMERTLRGPKASGR